MVRQKMHKTLRPAIVGRFGSNRAGNGSSWCCLPSVAGKSFRRAKRPIRFGLVRLTVGAASMRERGKGERVKMFLARVFFENSNDVFYENA